MALAIFDLDNTLIAGDSDHAWGEFVVEKGLVDRNSYREANDRFYADYQAGRLDVYAYQEFALSALANYSLGELDALHREFMTCKIAPMHLPLAERLLERHRVNGDRLLIITSTNRFITEPIAKCLGVEHLLATEGEIRNGRFTGRLAGVPCYREGKVERLNAWLDEHGCTLEGSWFYSDSHNDLPLLSKVDHPVAVDPDDVLAEHARRAGWQIISLRN